MFIVLLAPKFSELRLRLVENKCFWLGMGQYLYGDIIRDHAQSSAITKICKNCPRDWRCLNLRKRIFQHFVHGPQETSACI